MFNAVIGNKKLYIYIYINESVCVYLYVWLVMRECNHSDKNFSSM